MRWHKGRIAVRMTMTSRGADTDNECASDAHLSREVRAQRATISAVMPTEGPTLRDKISKGRQGFRAPEEGSSERPFEAVRPARPVPVARPGSQSNVRKR